MHRVRWPFQRWNSQQQPWVFLKLRSHPRSEVRPSKACHSVSRVNHSRSVKTSGSGLIFLVVTGESLLLGWPGWPPIPHRIKHHPRTQDHWILILIQIQQVVQSSRILADDIDQTVMCLVILVVKRGLHNNQADRHGCMSWLVSSPARSSTNLAQGLVDHLTPNETAGLSGEGWRDEKLRRRPAVGGRLSGSSFFTQECLFKNWKICQRSAQLG